MSAYFITGTGTEVGKTFVTCLIIRQLRALSSRSGQADRSCKRVRAIKPVISGYGAERSDSRALAEALGLRWSEATENRLSPWRFAAPVSPHLAAEREGRTVETEALLAFCRAAVADAGGDTLLIEGAGGVMTPVNDTLLTADWIAALGIPAVLVAGSYLGAISHTLTAYETLAGRGVPLAGAVIVESAESGVTLADTLGSLRRFLPASRPILELPRRPEDATIPVDAPDLTRLLA